MTKDILRDWRLMEDEMSEEDSEQEPGFYSNQVGPDPPPAPDDPKGYDPYERAALGTEVGISLLGEHSALLYQALQEDGRLPRHVQDGKDAGKLRHVIRRLQVQDNKYARWETKISEDEEDEGEEDASMLMEEIRHGALCREEWTLFFCGLGGFLHPEWKKIATRRNRYENPVQVPPPQGWWTRVNNAKARMRLVGRGPRSEKISRQTIRELKKDLSNKGGWLRRMNLTAVACD